MLDSLTLPPLVTLHGERVTLRGPRDSDVDDRLRHPIDPEEEDGYGSAWRQVQSKATEDIFVRLITPGQMPVAERRRSTAWNATTQTCDSSMQMILSSAPSDAGHCTQVGYVADNPGYNPNATPAAPLRKVVASAGPAC